MRTLVSNKLLMGLAALVAAGLFAGKPALAQLQQGDFLCSYGAVYNIVWDGWSGKLTLLPPGYPDYVYKGYLDAGGKRIGVRYVLAENPQDFVDGRQGPGYIGTPSTAKHRIVFWVDFNNTPFNHSDDQRFDGYIMTQTRSAIAGVTWWNGIVFGFYAAGKLCIPG